MTNSININGINFYSSATSCFSQYNQLPWTQKIISFIASFGNLFTFALNKQYVSARYGERSIEPYTKMPQEDSSCKKLVVCLHGLNNSPLQFKKIIDEINPSQHPEITLYVPKIREKGNAKLDEMVAPILADVAAWAKTGTEKQLVLVGISNGARIAKAISAELINSGQTGQIKHIRFVSIVGAGRGSVLANLANYLHLSWLFLSKNIAEEMPTNSARFKKLNREFRLSLMASKLTHDNFFISSAPWHDWQVPNPSSTLMNLFGKPAMYAIVPNHGHNSTPNAVAKSVASIIVRE